MKLKHIAAAAALLSAGGAFAAPVVCPTNPTLNDMLSKCTPDVTFYIGGASAQSAALDNVLTTSTIFDTTKPRGKVYLTSASVSGLNGQVTTDITKSNTVAYVGLGGAGVGDKAGKLVMVIYNKANGSAAGVQQLLTGKGVGAAGTAADESITLLTVSKASLAKGISGAGCTVTTDSVSGSVGAAACTTEIAFKKAWGNDAQKAMHMALSDVRPTELSPGIIKKWDTTKFPATATGMQGFGVIVNPMLYTALIARDVSAGRLANSCLTSETVGGTTDVITLACQPSLSRADYASIITGKANAATLMNNSDATVLNLARRVDSSGTQASSNIFFAGQAGYNAKATAADGFADILPAGTAANGVVVTANAGTGDVITAVSGNTTSYAIGVVSLENTYAKVKASSKLKGALFVKLDGISPNLKSDDSVDVKHRAGMQAGYPFAFSMVSLKPATLTGAYAAIADAINAGLVDPARDLAGIAYIGSSDATKNTSYVRTGANNYLPLTK